MAESRLFHIDFCRDSVPRVCYRRQGGVASGMVFCTRRCGSFNSATPVAHTHTHGQHATCSHRCGTHKIQKVTTACLRLIESKEPHGRLGRTQNPPPWHRQNPQSHGRLSLPPPRHRHPKERCSLDSVCAVALWILCSSWGWRRQAAVALWILFAPWRRLELAESWTGFAGLHGLELDCCVGWVSNQ